MDGQVYATSELCMSYEPLTCLSVTLVAKPHGGPRERHATNSVAN